MVRFKAKGPWLSFHKLVKGHCPAKPRGAYDGMEA